MGIQGLIHFLHEASQCVRISQFAGQTAAVDGFVWMHRSVLSCAREIALGLKTRSYITSFLKRVQQLIDASIIPIIVFDGGDLPAKQPTNEKRRAARSIALEKAKSYEQRGMTAEALEQFKLAVDITPDLLYPLFTVLRRRHIKFIVAPYEADAQLSFLVQNNIANFAITEDSDLLVYRCPQTLFKLTSNGDAELFTYDSLFKLPQLADFTPKMFTEACVLSGCDYLSSIHGMGIKTAFKKMSTYKSGISVLFELSSDPTLEIPPDYIELYPKVLSVFEEQVVYDPKNKITRGIFKNPETPLAGSLLASSVSIEIAEGHRNARTLEPFPGDDYEEEDLTTSGRESPYFTPISKSASQPFKPHFGNPMPPIKPRRIKLSQIPDRSPINSVSGRMSVPLFIPPSLRFPH